MKNVMFRPWCALLLSLILGVSCSVMGDADAQNKESAFSGKTVGTSTGKRIVGYFAQWSIYAGHNNYRVSMIPFEKLTHINYAFAGIQADGSGNYSLLCLDAWADEQNTFGVVSWGSEYAGNLGQLKYYKTIYPHLKTLISVGGWTRSDKFHEMAMTAQGRQSFAASCVAWLRKWNMDGVDIDWEYPGVSRVADSSDANDKGSPGGPEDTVNYTLLMRDIRAALDAAGAADGKHYELTAAIGAGYDKIALTDPAAYSQYMDCINLMTYDFHGGWESVIGEMAPLYRNSKDPHEALIAERYTIDWIVNHMMELGVPASKLTVGLPFYSRGWNNVVPNTSLMPGGMFGTGSSSLTGAWGVGGQGPYSDIETLRSGGSYTEYWDDESKQPYLYSPSTGNLYIYDNERSIGLKCDYINLKKLAGAMYWEIDGDPNKTLVNMVHAKMNEGVVVSSSSSSSSVSSVSSSASSVSSSVSSISSVSSSSSSSLSSVSSSSVPSDGPATGVPGAPSLSQSDWNGNPMYTITMNMWWGNNGTVWELYENGVLVSSKVLTDKSPASQTASCAFTGKANGTYVYTTRLINRFGATSGNTLTIKVTQGAASSASSSSQSSVSSSSSSSVSSSVSSSSSSSVISSSSQSSVAGVKAWASYVNYAAGDLVSYGGSVYSCRQAHLSLPGWEPSNVPALWTLTTYTTSSASSSVTSSSSVSSSSSSVVSSSSSSASSVSTGSLPKHILTGYWQNFNNGAKVLRISDVPTTYDLICVSFADATATPGAVTFNLDTSLGFSEAQFIADIATAKARGQHVIISVGGERGSVSVNDYTSAVNFANSINALMDKYGFEGVDIDLENGINATYMAQALRSIKKGSIITMAPQTIDMQSTGMGYFSLCLQIKDILTLVNMQYYNSGSMLGYDGKVYSQGGVDFLTALATIQLENGLRADQVGLGLPASTSGAGSGYVDPSVVNRALDCLVNGVNGGSYLPPHTYPTLRGVMTWSINWDASNGYNFANTVKAKLNTLP